MGHAARPVDVDVDADRAALRDRLDDDTRFDDPFYHQTFRTQDFVLAASIRLTGPDRFTFLDHALLIGYGCPRFDDATRTALLEQARRTGREREQPAGAGCSRCPRHAAERHRLPSGNRCRASTSGTISVL